MFFHTGFIVHVMLIYGWLLWWLLLGRYLKGVIFHCIPSDYTKTEYGFWANPTILSKDPTNDLPCFDQPDCCNYIHCFPSDSMVYWVGIVLSISYHSFVFFCALFRVMPVLFLPWWFLLGRYLKGMTFKCTPSDYTKTEYGFWANPAMPL